MLLAACSRTLHGRPQPKRLLLPYCTPLQGLPMSRPVSQENVQAIKDAAAGFLREKLRTVVIRSVIVGAHCGRTPTRISTITPCPNPIGAPTQAISLPERRIGWTLGGVHSRGKCGALYSCLGDTPTQLLRWCKWRFNPSAGAHSVVRDPGPRWVTFLFNSKSSCDISLCVFDCSTLLFLSHPRAPPAMHHSGTKMPVLSGSSNSATVCLCCHGIFLFWRRTLKTKSRWLVCVCCGCVCLTHKFVCGYMFVRVCGCVRAFLLFPLLL